MKLFFVTGLCLVFLFGCTNYMEGDSMQNYSFVKEGFSQVTVEYKVTTRPLWEEWADPHPKGPEHYQREDQKIHQFLVTEWKVSVFPLNTYVDGVQTDLEYGHKYNGSESVRGTLFAETGAQLLKDLETIKQKGWTIAE